MDIKFYNSLSGEVELFTPQIPGEVSMYVCGPTVYGYPHIGNMRPVVVFDTLRRFLSYVGYHVTYVSNFTDVDDKIIKESIKEGKSEKELTDFYIEAFKDVSLKIGSMLPDITPRVTEYIPAIIKYIAHLVEIGAAYEVNGDVYFRVGKIEDYGSLSNINVDDLKVGARIEESSIKESPLDFALWKKTDVGINWDSPWGKGRPGWHTECCVMIDTIFPSHLIDIHGGGYDLKFPHHENEIAQAEASHNHKIAKYWMHNAFINFGTEKMSKSLGNVIYAKDLIEKVGGPVARMVIISTHYRMPVTFTEETLEAAKQEVSKIEFAYRQLALLLQVNNVNMDEGKPLYIDNFLQALGDDLNTANALMEIFNLVKLVNSNIRTKEPNLELLNNYFKTLKDMLCILGLNIEFHTLTDEDKALYNSYMDAKRNKDFQKSDELRAILIERKIL